MRDSFLHGIFPTGFLWGTSTGSFNVEGAWAADGKGESIWDRFGHQGHAHLNQTADVASDSYHKIPYDVYLLRGLQPNIYKFSISWPRLFPNGNNNSLNPQAAKLDAVDVQSYIARSLMDGFEGTAGYSQRFGLHHVNFEDANRLLREQSHLKAFNKIPQRCSFLLCLITAFTLHPEITYLFLYIWIFQNKAYVF
uniref:Beta-glucosidase n=1 Tax=Salvator merianae TaxID=96440 RepID=A0A8D0C6R5_SALMN